MPLTGTNQAPLPVCVRISIRTWHPQDGEGAADASSVGSTSTVRGQKESWAVFPKPQKPNMPRHNNGCCASKKTQHLDKATK